jgi:ATP-dependent DNA helicase PIF1
MVIINLQKKFNQAKCEIIIIFQNFLDQSTIGLVGNVVNVPVDTVETLKFLPREFKESQTIQLKFMRKAEYKNPYMFDNIRPAFVYRALKYLLDKELFIEQGILLSQKWETNNLHNGGNYKKFIVESDDELECLTETITDNKYDRNVKVAAQKENLSKNDDSPFLEQNVSNQTLLDNQIMVASCDSGFSVSLLFDKYGEELTFLKIYGGNKLAYPASLSYETICRSELLRYDRRCAENVTKIFYSYKKLLAFRLVESIKLSLKRATNPVSSTKLTLQTNSLLNDDKLNEFQHSVEAKMFRGRIKSTPQFWSKIKMDLNAMIHQLGNPSFILTFKPCEQDWNELLIILLKILDNSPTICNDTVKNLNKSERIQLINRDPVTTSRYFENRIRGLMKIIASKDGPFCTNVVKDYFWKVDFNYSSLPSVFLLIWNKDAPSYASVDELEADVSDNNTDFSIVKNYHDLNTTFCTNFADKFVSCHKKSATTNDAGINSNNSQQHVHTLKCHVNDKNRNSSCKKNYPWPIFETTTILEPLSNQYQSASANSKQIKSNLNKINIKLNQLALNLSEQSLEEMLHELKISFDDYIIAIRSSINVPTVFYKRSSCDIMTIPYNSTIIAKLRSKMCIQYVAHSYQIAALISTKILKCNTIMSNILEKANEEMKNGNISIKQRLNVLANKFQNCLEISAQECSYMILNMPVCKSSRETIYINVLPTEDRLDMIKHMRHLDIHVKTLYNDSFGRNVFEIYKSRPCELVNVCLAEFASEFNWFDKASKMLDFEKTSSIPLIPDMLDLTHDKDQKRYELFHNEKNYELDKIVQNNNCSLLLNTLDPILASDYQLLKCENKKGFVCKRMYARILNYESYCKNKDPNNFYRSQLLLFFPWKKEKEVDLENAFELYSINRELIEKNHNKFVSKTAGEFERLQKKIESETVLKSTINATAVNVSNASEHLLTSEDDENNEHVEDEYGYHGFIEDSQMYLASKADSHEQIHVPLLLNDFDYANLMASLNQEQNTYLLNTLHNIKNSKLIHNFVSGAQGSGKSHLINALFQNLTRFFTSKSDANSHVKNHVLIGANTGSAAFNVKGDTLTKIFRLPTKSKIMLPLSESLLAKVRKQFVNLKLIILDEVSQIGTILIEKINQRLKQIMNSQEDFGGISIIVVGHFYQLGPVMDKRIFMSSGKNVYGNLVDNPLWSKFTLYELTGKMRQQNQPEFTHALNLIGECGVESLNDTQLNLLNSRFVNDQSEIPSDAIVLFFENQDAFNYNKERISKLPGELVENNAVDIAVGKKSTTLRAQNFAKQCKNIKKLEDTGGLQYNLYLKNECRYFITINQDVSDGIVNGAVGILKKIILHKKAAKDKTKVKRVWLLFENKDIGKKSRENNIDLCAGDDVDASLYWTPINCIRQRVKTNNVGGGYAIERIQLPIEEAEAFTIHKSQGKTYQKVAVNVSSSLTKALLYVAMSRVTSLEGLYLFGPRKSIMSEKKSQLSHEKRRKLVEKNANKCTITIEMERMRQSCRMVNNFPFLSDNESEKNSFKIMFHNCGSFIQNKNYIQNDMGFMKADVLLLQNTNNSTKEDLNQMTLKGYDIISNTRKNDVRNTSGQMCLIKKELKKKISFIADNLNGKNNDDEYNVKVQLEMSLYKYDYLCSVTKSFYICSLYKHIGMDNKQFYDEFRKFLVAHLSSSRDSTRINKRLLILGNFNMDFNKMPKSLEKLYNDLQLMPEFINTPTHKSGGQFDWCFTNTKETSQHQQNMNAFAYESFFSDYSPIWLNIYE